jgi:hypothetical protein
MQKPEVDFIEGLSPPSHRATQFGSQPRSRSPPPLRFTITFVFVRQCWPAALSDSGSRLPIKPRATWLTRSWLCRRRRVMLLAPVISGQKESFAMSWSGSLGKASCAPGGWSTGRVGQQHED